MDYNYNVAGSYNFNNSTFLASIDRDGNIIHESANGRKKIGVDTQTAQEMQSVIDNYYNKLVELGIFVKEKTPEELALEQAELLKEQAKEQAEINQALLKAINGLNNKVEELSSHGNARNVDTEVSTNVGENRTRSTTSIGTSKKNDTKQSK